MKHPSLSLAVAATICFLTPLTGCDRPPESSKQPTPPPKALRLQLNWFHDPTFCGEYLTADAPDLAVIVREGGPNISAVAEVAAGRADFAVVGADIFLKALLENRRTDGLPQIMAVFADLQRNPVGWVLHPRVAADGGLTSELAADPAKANAWLFRKVLSGDIKIGDKRGTETTSVWMKWKEVHNVPDTITVVPVGFDPSMVLSAPAIAYPVYLNEEPFKLSARLNQEVAVFDPAADGVDLYGNVVIAKRSLVEQHPELVRRFQEELRRAWQQARANQHLAVEKVGKLYDDVTPDVLAKQISKTLDFVFYGGALPGQMDTMPGGRWEHTLQALQAAGIIDSPLSFSEVQQSLFPIQ